MVLDTKIEIQDDGKVKYTFTHPEVDFMTGSKDNPEKIGVTHQINVALLDSYDKAKDHLSNVVAGIDQEVSRLQAESDKIAIDLDLKPFEAFGEWVDKNKSSITKAKEKLFGKLYQDYKDKKKILGHIKLQQQEKDKILEQIKLLEEAKK